MAHDAKKRITLRGLYIYEQLPIEQAAKKAGIPIGTAKRWKQEAKSEKDDWDKQRAALSLGDENFKQLSQQLLNDYLVQHQSTIDMLKNAKDMSAMSRAETLASLSDSFNKTMASFKRLSPDLNRQAIQLDVMQRYARFVAEKYPKALSALAETIEPFGVELAAG